MRLKTKITSNENKEYIHILLLLSKKQMELNDISRGAVAIWKKSREIMNDIPKICNDLFYSLFAKKALDYKDIAALDSLEAILVDLREKRQKKDHISK